jgi:organic radical activating enzyme
MGETPRKGRLAVSEYFYSLQGEGRTVGTPAVFLRLAGCNLMCGGSGTERDGLLHNGATWRCDTIEVWMKGQSVSYAELSASMEARVGALTRLRAGAHLVITGGEPLIQEQELIGLLDFWESEWGLVPIIEVETNACYLPTAEFDQHVHYWNTSPKLSNSGMTEEKRLIPEVLRWFAAQYPRTMSKFVVSAPEDWDEIKRDFLDTALVRREALLLMPAASSRQELQDSRKWLADLCIREQVRMGTRLHVEIWDRLTGV